jgi:salicylate hydroxylase
VTKEQIPKAIQVCEAIRKLRAEKVKMLLKLVGWKKHYPDGEKQRERDEQMRIRMETLLKKIR